MSTLVKLPQVRSTIQRWVEDQMEANQVTKEDLAAALDISNEKTTRRLSGSSDFKAEELLKMAQLFNKHWYYDIVQPFEIGAAEISLAMAISLAREEGKYWGMLDQPA